MFYLIRRSFLFNLFLSFRLPSPMAHWIERKTDFEFKCLLTSRHIPKLFSVESGKLWVPIYQITRFVWHLLCNFLFKCDNDEALNTYRVLVLSHDSNIDRVIRLFGVAWSFTLKCGIRGVTPCFGDHGNNKGFLEITTTNSCMYRYLREHKNQFNPIHCTTLKLAYQLHVQNVNKRWYVTSQ